MSSSRMRSACFARVCAGLVCGALLCSAPVAAHHSFTAVYDMNKVIEIKGRITTVRWVNPHITIDVADDNGQKWVIIETSRIKYHSYGDFGPAQSDQSHVVERFTLSADGRTLDYDIAVTDPVMLSGPWSWRGSFFATDETMGTWDCSTDSTRTALTASGVLLGLLVWSVWTVRRWKSRAQRASPST